MMISIYLQKLDLIFVKLSEIYGYLFEHVKRTCVALSDPGIYAEICTFLERMEESSASLLCLVLTFRADIRVKRTHARTHNYTVTYLRTHTHAHTLTL